VIARVIIIGTGEIARSHARGIQELPDVEIAAACDVRSEAVGRFADEFRIPGRYTSVEDLIARESADVAVVATWGHTHAAITRQLATSQKVRAILCEKPLCRNATEAEEMRTVTQANGVLLAEAFRFRHDPIHFVAKEMIQGGRIGRVSHVRCALVGMSPPEARRPELNWRFNPQAGGGTLYDIGCYALGFIRYVLAANPEVVSAFGRWGEISGVDEHVHAQLQFATGVTADFLVSWDSTGGQFAEVLGTAGVLRIDEAWGGSEPKTRAIQVTDARGNQEATEYPDVSQFAVQTQHMIDCLRTGQPHRIPIADSVAQMHVIDALYESLRTRQAVRVRY
jgi:predicted dehydrogenase